jgi:hypothetical protein
MNTEQFRASLPRGPLVQHVTQVHHILSLAYMDKNALEMAEHSLRAIAAYTAEQPFAEPRNRWLAAMERERHAPQLLGTHTPNPLLSPEAVERIAAAGRSMQESVRKGFANMARRVEERRLGNHLHGTLDTEAYSERKYEAKIDHEREVGRAFIKNYAWRTRSEIRRRGLDIPRI